MPLRSGKKRSHTKKRSASKKAKTIQLDPDLYPVGGYKKGIYGRKRSSSAKKRPAIRKRSVAKKRPSSVRRKRSAAPRRKIELDPDVYPEHGYKKGVYASSGLSDINEDLFGDDHSNKALVLFDRTSHNEEVKEAAKMFGLEGNYTKQQVSASFARLVRQWHPDKCTKDRKPLCEEMQKKLVDARNVLVNAL